MRFIKKLLTPVLAAILLVGGAALAQEGLPSAEEPESEPVEWTDAGDFQWRYADDEGVLYWGDCDPTVEDRCFEVEVVDTTDDPEPPEGDPEDEPEVSHGDVVSSVAHFVKELDESEEGLPAWAKNRGDVISALSKGTTELSLDDDEDEETAESPELEDDDHDEDGEDDGPPDHAKGDKEDHPGNAKGKDK